MNEKKITAFSIMNWKLPDELGYFNRLLAEINAEGELLPDEQLQQMLNDSSNIPHYVNLLLQYVAETEALEESLAENIRQLQARKQRFSNRIASFKNYLEMIMGRYDLKKFECPNGTISKVIKKKSRLQIVNEGDILLNYPEYFIKQEPVLDKQKLKADLQNGKVVAGADLIDTEFIQVRK